MGIPIICDAVISEDKGKNIQKIFKISRFYYNKTIRDNMFLCYNLIVIYYCEVMLLILKLSSLLNIN